MRSRVNQKMLNAAAKVLGYEVDAERVDQAFDEMPENYTPTAARKRLTECQAAFNEAGGRGVDLAEEIDNLRIYLACHDKQGNSFKHYTLKVKVKAPDTMSRGEVVGMVQRLIENGQEEASDSLECDVDTSDAEDALALECKVG